MASKNCLNFNIINKIYKTNLRRAKSDYLYEYNDNNSLEKSNKL